MEIHRAITKRDHPDGSRTVTATLTTSATDVARADLDRVLVEPMTALAEQVAKTGEVALTAIEADRDKAVADALRAALEAVPEEHRASVEQRLGMGATGS